MYFELLVGVPVKTITLYFLGGGRGACICDVNLFLTFLMCAVAGATGAICDEAEKGEGGESL